jgi:hypothetical protein
MIVITEKRIGEDFSGQDLEKIKKGKYKTARFSTKDSTIVVTIDKPTIGGSKRINFYNGQNSVTIDTDKIKKLSAVGDKDSNWKIDMTDGSVLYLNA